MEDTVYNYVVFDLLNGLDELGIERSKILSQLNLTESDLKNDMRIPMDKVEEIWSMLIKKSPDPAIGLKVSLNTDPKEYGIFAALYFSSKNALQGMRMYEKYINLISHYDFLKLEIVNDVVKLSYNFPDLPHSIQVIERTFVMALVLTNKISTKIVRPLSLNLVHQKPEYYRAYTEIFNCEISFSSEQNNMIFSREDLERENLVQNNYLNLISTNHADKLLDQVKMNTPFITRVTNILMNNVSNTNFGLSNLAKDLGMSDRSIRRKLQEADLSFIQLKNKIRMDISITMLDKNHTIQEVTYFLNFSDQSAFSKAFKKWTGVSPANYIKVK